MNIRKLLKTAPTILGVLSASIVAASAGNFTTSTTNVVNPNGVAISDAGNNMISYETFTNSVAQAWATNSGGVWDLDAPSGWTLANGNVATLTYGPAQTNSLTLTHETPGGDYVSQVTGGGGAGIPTSGSYVRA